MRWGRKRWVSHEQEAAQRIAELTASRRVIVEAYEVERRRIERDLHDGAQQYLVAAAMKVGEAQLSPAVENDPVAAQLLAEANTAIQEGLGALRRTIRGIHPQLLRQQGLPAALEEVAATVEIDEISEHLYTKGQPDPDLIIRTSGEQRLSGFLLWQSAHSEFYFCEALWPDFRKVDFVRALRNYTQRERRFGR